MRDIYDPLGNSRTDAESADSGFAVQGPEELALAMEAYRPYLLLVANKEIAPVLRSKGGASDLVQETFLEAHRDFDQFSGRSPNELKCWLRQILRHNVANFVRRYRVSSKRRITREIPMDRDSSYGLVRECLTSSALSPSGLAILREEAARLETALGQLCERDRLVYTWRMKEYCDWKEIGRRIGGSDDKARKVFTRAVARLRKAVGDSQDSSSGTP